MKNQPSPDLSRAVAERLLNGEAVGVPHLEHLLAAAASVPAGSHGGEAAVVAAFNAAGMAPAGRFRRLTAMKSAIAAVISSKLIAGTAVAVAATGGIALAASHGAFDTTPPTHHGTSGTHTPSTVASNSATNRPTASPSPNLSGLCHAYEAGATANRGQALNSPAFQALVTAAGGANSVGTYCTTLLGTSTPAPNPHASSHPSGRPTALPSQVGGHATPPAQAPNHPTSTSHPTASNHPSGRPTGIAPSQP